MAISAGRFLIKLHDPAAPTSLRLSARIGVAGAEITLDTEPLFQSIGQGSGRGLQARPGVWRLARTAVELDEGEAWAACHQIAQDPNIAHVEPDIQQRWPILPPSRLAHGFGARGAGPEPQDIGDGYAGDPGDNYWFRNDRHSQLAAALAASDGGAGVRIAHLDTGYDSAHKSVPKRLRADLARNFVDPEHPGDATDRSSDALFNNFSHGCGTLSILAGATVPGFKPFGGAPEAEVVPVRVADRVVLFSNSTIARGLDYVHQLCRSNRTRVHVVSMSMGGLPSQAWAEAINALYEAGVVVVTAAGNNFNNLPTRFIVYPARFGRVIAACGAMADGGPYANLPPGRMAGNYGPDSKSATALAAFTPNVPWARFGEPAMVDFDGNGTSSATPQIAAAAALWIGRRRAEYDAYPEPWMRVEAVRRTLFDSAARGAAGHAQEFGSGLLHAADALARAATPVARLRATPADSADSGFLKLLIGDLAPGFAEATKASLLELEAAQVAVAVGLDPGTQPRTQAAPKEAIEKMLGEGKPSAPLRAALEKAGVPSSTPKPQAPAKAGSPAAQAMNQHFLRQALNPPAPVPPYRRLRIYAYDPGQQTDPNLFDVSVVTVTTRWEKDLKPGPIGDYLEIVDIDPASQACYAPVNLNDPKLLAENGLSPSESNPQFHQQMAYAVAMRTIERFERALGRTALWARRKPEGGKDPPDDGYVRKLRIYPHALRDANAYYDPEKKALLFGYFNARAANGSVTAGARIFSVVSHDIVAHETTHALLDGLHPRYSEGTNLDMAAFHEAFADIVALFQHFSMPESLTRQIRRAHGSPTDIGRSLGRLAQQFGEATGMHGALRKFVGETGDAIPVLADHLTEPHDRGAVLVSAVFDAFLTIFKSRCADLIRLATGGSGILPDGEISADLANRLAQEASTSAEHVLNMCIRALDYCPPVNLEFGDYLRGLLTADYDLVRDDRRGYRVAFIDAFRRRGIVPYQIQHLAQDSLLWEPPAMDDADLRQFDELFIDKEMLDLESGLTIDREIAFADSRASASEIAFKKSRANAIKFDTWLTEPGPDRNRLREILGFQMPEKQHVEHLTPNEALTGEIRPIEVHSVRICRRSAPDGETKSTLVVEITQTFLSDPDQERYRGGCTLLFDLKTYELKYLVRKRLLSPGVVQGQRFARAAAMKSAASHGQVYYAPNDPAAKGKTFAMMHRCGRDM